MQIYIILASLLLCISIMLQQYTHAVSFCATSPEGKIYVDECNYSSNEECTQAAGKPGCFCYANPEYKNPDKQ